MTDQCRALFEVGLSEVLAEKLSDGSYSTFWVQAEWTVWQGAWQAARRAEPEKVEPFAWITDAAKFYREGSAAAYAKNFRSNPHPLDIPLYTAPQQEQK